MLSRGKGANGAIQIKNMDAVRSLQLNILRGEAMRLGTQALLCGDTERSSLREDVCQALERMSGS